LARRASGKGGAGPRGPAAERASKRRRAEGDPASAPPAGAASAPAPLYAPHRTKDHRFFNPWRRPPTRHRDLLRWKLEPNPYDKRSPPSVPVVRNDGAYLADGGAPDSITWVGHSSFAIQDGGQVFVTDPHWGPRALLFRRLSPPGIPLAAVPASAFAVVSHNHYDHLDAWTVARLPASVDWYVPLGLAAWLRQRRHAAARPGGRGPRAEAPEAPRRAAGAPGKTGRRPPSHGGRTAAHGGPARPVEVVELDWWQSVRRGPWTLTCLPAQHWSNRIEASRNTTLWCSWLLDSGRRRYYFAGDTGYFPGFAEIGRRFAPIDVALLPIGAYEPRWFMAYPHLDPAEAYRAFLDLGARWLVPMHWGTFDLTNEPIDLAPRALAEAVAAADGDPSRVRLLAVGERWLLPGGQP
jgi:N-acyl-phosphatidylethanolamine-hydrolysing phospholipase D